MKLPNTQSEKINRSISSIYGDCFSTRLFSLNVAHKHENVSNICVTVTIFIQERLFVDNDAVGCDFDGLNCLFDNSVTSTYVWRTHTVFITTLSFCYS